MSVDREYAEFIRVVKASVSESFEENDDIPEDWSYNSDVAVALMRMAAEITVMEELKMPAMGGGRGLFIEWAERSYDDTKEFVIGTFKKGKQ